MEIWQYLMTAAGGAIGIKILDIVWLQRVVREAERTKWMREKRLEAYSKLVGSIASLGSGVDQFSTLTQQALAGETILLVDDPKFKAKISKFHVSISRLHKLADKGSDSGPSKELISATKIADEEASKIINILRESLRNDK